MYIYSKCSDCGGIIRSTESKNKERINNGIPIDKCGRCIRKYIHINKICPKCNSNFTITKDNLLRRSKKSYDLDLCPKCLNKQITSSSEYRNKRSKISKKIWKKRSHRERLEKIWNSDEYKKLHRNLALKQWENMSDEEIYQRKLKTQLSWKNMTDEEKNRLSKLKSENAKRMWNNMTKDEYEKWNLNRAIGYNDYLDKLNNYPNKNELSFIEILNLNDLIFQFQYYNTIKYPDFNKLFPNNPVTSSNLVSPYHQWDFIIYTLDGPVLVDIDGSIHDPDKTRYEVTNKNGVKFKLNELMTFNDSQRPYQTDGLPAYAVLCYDDNITNDTLVKNINTGEIMNIRLFIPILIFMNIDYNERSKLINEYKMKG